MYLGVALCDKSSFSQRNTEAAQRDSETKSTVGLFGRIFIYTSFSGINFTVVAFPSRRYCLTTL